MISTSFRAGKLPLGTLCRSDIHLLSLRASSRKSNGGDGGTGSSGGSGSGHKLKTLAPSYVPKTANQKEYLKYLTDPSVALVLGVGPAGTGKTLFACHTAIQLLKRGTIQKIVLTRPVVSVEEDLGFLPGNLVMKMDPWTRPIFDILLEFYSQKDVDAMVQSGVIEISPLAYMRGRTFKRAFIIADEMQNSSPNQMMMLTTRIGEGSKMVITGDLKQSDRYAENGLLDLLNKLDRFRSSALARAIELAGFNTTVSESSMGIFPKGIRSVEMTLADVERSAIVRQVLSLYEPETFRSPPLNNHTDVGAPESPLHNATTSFELVDMVQDTRNDDAALIPKEHLLRNPFWKR